jgi:hypothetical protein
VEYTVVFDVRESGYRYGWIATAPLILAVFAPIWVYAVLRYRGRKLPRWCYAIMPLPPVALSAFWLLTSWTDYSRLRSALEQGRCVVVEGVIQDYRAAPPTGHGKESFVVNSQYFEFQEGASMPGFSFERRNGGPLANGVRVRVHHMGNDIARLEVAR